MHLRPTFLYVAAVSAVTLLAACGGGGTGGGGPVGVLGALNLKPEGGLYYLDDHRSGQRTRLHLTQLTWGRLVDVYSVDAEGEPLEVPYLSDLVVDETILDDGENYLLRTQPVTQREQLIILRHRAAGPAEEAGFQALLDAARSALPGVQPLADDATVGGPFSLVPRNATLVLHFDDLLKDDAEALRRLPDVIRLATGSPPTTPWPARFLFDPNHGGVVGGEFHSTRILVDFTVSVLDAANSPTTLAVEPRGLPASRTDILTASAALRFPTRFDPGSGVFFRLTNLAGSPLDESGNGPVDFSSPTRDVLRAFRAGNRNDLNGGYLLDARAPELLSEWPCSIESARDDPLGLPGANFVVDLRFSTPCRTTPAPGDVLTAGIELIEIVERASLPDLNGEVQDVRVRLLTGSADARALPGAALYVTTYDESLGLDAACWVTFTPPGANPPAVDLPGDTTIRVRFNEPIEPETVLAFDTLRLVRGDSESVANPEARDLVVGEVDDAEDLRSFVFRPVVPLTNEDGGRFYLDLDTGLGGIRDLAGNLPSSAPSVVDFRLDPAEPTPPSRAIVMRFESQDELAPPGLLDLRGQIFLDTERGVGLPRPVRFASWPVDRGNPVPQLMQPFPPGVQTPLSPLGSRLMALWRYADLDWRIRDETKYNLDVIGMSWSPVGGFPLNDFFPQFEMRVAHSIKIPDEAGDNALGPVYRNSGLLTGSFPFSSNVLGQAEDQLKTVHARDLGYVISVSDLFVNSHGVAMVPFPWNRSSGPFTTFTWRDTSDLRRGGTAGAGVPLTVEVDPPLAYEDEVGSFAQAGGVPTVGLPFLWEINTYPTTQGVGLNPLDVALGSPPGWQFPRFRAYSTGGIDETGNVVRKEPSNETHPTGGFNPSSNPPGKPTRFPSDPIFYMGQLETVVRVSRGFTAWIDSTLTSPSYTRPVIEPSPDEQPRGTSILIEGRTARDFDVSDPVLPFDGTRLDAYGELSEGQVDFVAGGPTWSEDFASLGSGRFLQLRFTFFNDLESQETAEISSLGVVAVQED